MTEMRNSIINIIVLLSVMNIHQLFVVANMVVLMQLLGMKILKTQC